MRVIQTYLFGLSTKTPYSDYPAIARRFLEEQKLVSHRFLYYFDESVCTFIKSYEETLISGGCAKAVRDCPALGEIRTHRNPAYGSSPMLFLSNIDSDAGCTEADILPHMKKIHRRYGFRESDIYYYDVDFFGHVIPFGRDLTHVEQNAAHFQQAPDSTFLLHSQPYGSGIRLHRYCTGGNDITLSIDILHDGKIYDPTPYFEHMKALLPKIHPTVSMQIYLTDAEKQEITSQGKQIEPVLEKVCAFFTERFPGKDQQIDSFPTYTIASKVKKLAKQHGFSYHYAGFGVCVLDKRTPRGHVIRLEVSSGPSHGDTTYSVNIQGIGFRHILCYSMQTPENQAESDACSEKMFSVVAEFEKTLLPELDAFYAETPDWFVPSF